MTPTDPPVHPDQERAKEALEDAVEQLQAYVEPTSGKGLAALFGGFLVGSARRRVRRARPRVRALRRFGWGIAIVVLAFATCSFGVDTAALTASYGDPVPSSTRDAVRVIERGAAAVQRGPDTGMLRVTMTEAEATSALSLGLMMSDLMQAAGRIPPEEIQAATDLEALRERIQAEAERYREELAEQSGFVERALMKLDPRIRTGDVQVRFEPTGEVVVAGYVQAWRVRLPGVVVVSPHARDGELSFDFSSGRLGRVPLPELVFDAVGDLLARAILLGRDRAQITEISVGDGTLTFEGRLVGG